MNSPAPKLLLTTSPFLKTGVQTPRIMWEVTAATLPLCGMALYHFGLGAALVLLGALSGAVLAEALAQRHALPDGSAVLTGLLLGLTLPPGLPLWIAFTGGAVAILLGKHAFGGMGANLLNPALVARAFLQAAFPVPMTTWAAPEGGTNPFWTSGAQFVPPFATSQIDGVSAATPLAKARFEGVDTAAADLLLGRTSGSLGETASVVILVCGVWLLLRKLIGWRIPIAILVGTALTSWLLHELDPGRFSAPLFHLLTGGLLLGAFFMATDPVTSPITPRGCLAYGAGIGVLVVIIREFGGLPEGVMYAILLFNAATPLLDRVSQSRVYGTPNRRGDAKPATKS